MTALQAEMGTKYGRYLQRITTTKSGACVVGKVVLGHFKWMAVPLRGDRSQVQLEMPPKIGPSAPKMSTAAFLAILRRSRSSLSGVLPPPSVFVSPLFSAVGRAGSVRLPPEI